MDTQQLNRVGRATLTTKILYSLKAGLAVSLCLAGGSAFANSLSLGPFDQGVFSGTQPFNTTGTCTDVAMLTLMFMSLLGLLVRRSRRTRTHDK